MQLDYLLYRLPLVQESDNLFVVLGNAVLEKEGVVGDDFYENQTMLRVFF